MRAGKSGLNVGTRAKIVNITDSYDADMNGQHGTLVRPFKNFPIRDVGILIDPIVSGAAPTPATIYLNEFEVIK